MYCTTKGSKKEYCENINVNLNEKKKNKLDFEEEYSRMKNIFFNV